MAATVLPLKEALTSESSTPEGRKKTNKLLTMVLSAAIWNLFNTLRNQDGVTHESGPEYHIRGRQKACRTVGQTLIIVTHL